jgi:hypothetical protein
MQWDQVIKSGDNLPIRESLTVKLKIVKLFDTKLAIFDFGFHMFITSQLTRAQDIDCEPVKPFASRKQFNSSSPTNRLCPCSICATNTIMYTMRSLASMTVLYCIQWLPKSLAWQRLQCVNSTNRIWWKIEDEPKSSRKENSKANAARERNQKETIKFTINRREFPSRNQKVWLRVWKTHPYSKENWALNIGKRISEHRF